MLLCIVLVAVAMTPLTSASWATTPDNRRYVLPGVSSHWVSYWWLSAIDADGNVMTGLKFWTNRKTEATDSRLDHYEFHVYFNITQVHGLTLPRAGTAFIHCPVCPGISTLVPQGSLKTSYTLPKADTSITKFQVVVVALEDNTKVTTQGTSPRLSVTLDTWTQTIIQANQLPTEATLSATKPVAVFVLEKRNRPFSIHQLS